MSINKIGQAPITYTPYKNTINSSSKNASNTSIKNALYSANEGGVNKDTFVKDEKTSAILSQLEAMRKQMEQSDENNKNSISDLSKAMKIASRIMNGDKVPMKDRKFLAEKYPDLFKNALMFRRQNPEPKKYKSCLDDDDNEENNNGSVSSQDSANSNEQFLVDALDDLGE